MGHPTTLRATILRLGDDLRQQREMILKLRLRPVANFSGGYFFFGQMDAPITVADLFQVGL